MYTQFLKNMDQKISDLPLNIVKALVDSKMLPSAFADSESLPDVKPNIMAPPQHDRKDFLKVKHWDQGLYNKLRKTKKGEKDVDDESATTSCYMEDENGDSIPESTRSAARAKARGFWTELFKTNKDYLLYSKLDNETRDKYIALMENAYPWLRYCENNWKAGMIWQNHYKDWYSSAKKNAGEKAAKEKAAKEKVERENMATEGDVIDIDDDTNDDQDGQEPPAKRPRVDGETSAPKRRRVEEDEPTPPSSAYVHNNYYQANEGMFADCII